MHKFTKKTKVLIVTVAVLLVGGVAFAYWTNTGSGSGSATTGTNVGITIAQATSSAVLVPGGPSSTLAGTFTNTNDSPVYVNDVTATLASVTNGAGTPACTVADYALTTATISIDSQAAVDDSTTWSGIQVRLLNSATNQDACKGATIVLAYTSN